MKYPNTRYGNPEELRYYATGISLKDLAKSLRRSERSVKDWLDGKKRIPYWVPELVRLRAIERAGQMQQMFRQKFSTFKLIKLRERPIRAKKTSTLVQTATNVTNMQDARQAALLAKKQGLQRHQMKRKRATVTPINISEQRHQKIA